MAVSGATNTPRRRQQGASLIEVMVAVVILTLGLLSMAALHATAMRYSKMAEFRTTATQLAEDLSDRMRANARGVRNGNYVRAVAWNGSLQPQTPPPITCTSTCSDDAAAQQVAANDLQQWLNAALASLPGAGLYTQQQGAGSSVMDIWVAWQESSTNAGADAQAENLINRAYTCPAAMGVPNGVALRCLRFRVTL